MEAPKPINFSLIKKELTSEQGNKCTLQISYINDKIEFIVEKKGKIFKDRFKLSLTMSQIQENKYFKLFENPQEIIEELKEKMNSKAPILSEIENNSINLIIFLQNSKYKEASYNLVKENLELNKNPEDFKSIIEKLYDTIEELKKENAEIKNRLNKLENNTKDLTFKKNNFRWINNEVNIVNTSKVHGDYYPDILLGKNNSRKYYLSDGNRNHFIEFSFITNYFLKAIRISVDNYDCSLKNFKVEITSPLGTIENIGTFTRSKYIDNNGFQEFEINKGCKGIKLYLIDNWGEGGGNYILIKRIDFNASE